MGREDQDHLTEEQIREVQAGRAVWRPFVPLQITPTFLRGEPSAVDRLAALENPELAAKISEYDEREAYFAERLER